MSAPRPPRFRARRGRPAGPAGLAAGGTPRGGPTRARLLALRVLERVERGARLRGSRAPRRLPRRRPRHPRPRPRDGARLRDAALARPPRLPPRPRDPAPASRASRPRCAPCSGSAPTRSSSRAACRRPRRSTRPCAPRGRSASSGVGPRERGAAPPRAGAPRDRAARASRTIPSATSCTRSRCPSGSRGAGSRQLGPQEAAALAAACNDVAAPQRARERAPRRARRAGRGARARAGPRRGRRAGRPSAPCSGTAAILPPIPPSPRDASRCRTRRRSSWWRSSIPRPGERVLDVCAAPGGEGHGDRRARRSRAGASSPSIATRGASALVLREARRLGLGNLEIHVLDATQRARARGAAGELRRGCSSTRRAPGSARCAATPTSRWRVRPGDSEALAPDAARAAPSRRGAP